jgi:hypothetical protein
LDLLTTPVTTDIVSAINSVNTAVSAQEKKLLLFALAGIMFLLKDNPIFCGLTIFSDIMSIFRLV